MVVWTMSRMSLTAEVYMASVIYFWEKFQALVDQKPLIIDNYAILNKKNAPIGQKVLFCDYYKQGRRVFLPLWTWDSSIESKLQFIFPP